MAEKRRDNKGRILRTGESQRKDGRYAYKYTDATGKTRFIYAWKLVSTDKTPAGKRDDIPLRDKEREINRDIEDGIDTVGKKMTVCQLYAKQNRQRPDVKPSTVTNRKYLMNLLRNDPLGSKSIDAVKPSDAKEWVMRMREQGYAYQTINNYRRSLSAAFNIAIEDDCVRKNPFAFALNKVLENDRKEKIVLTPEQEKALLTFMQSDPTYQKYADEIIILLGTGLRISELCGLTFADLDFVNGILHIDHQLLRTAKDGFYIAEPKTKKGLRDISMRPEVRQALKRVLKRHGPKKITTVDGYTDFLFFTVEGLPQTRENFDGIVKKLLKKYNKQNKEPLPHITPHSFRHTFCTRMATAGMDPKSLQYIMGHSNIKMTLGYYTHADATSAKKAMDRIAA